MIGLFIAAAVVAVAFGGLLAAVDAALSVLSRTDLVDLAAHHRAKKSLLAISSDIGAHVNAVNFMRVVSETFAAVMVTLTFAEVFDQWWWVLLASAVVMTGTSFVLVGSSPRSVGRAHAKGIVAFSALIVRAIRVLLGPIADGLVALGNRVTPGRPKTAVTFSSEEQLLIDGRRGDRARRARGRRPRAHPLDLRMGRHGGARGDDPAHRHGDDRRGCLDRRRPRASSSAPASRASP